MIRSFYRRKCKREINRWQCLLRVIIVVSRVTPSFFELILIDLEDNKNNVWNIGTRHTIKHYFGCKMESEIDMSLHMCLGGILVEDYYASCGNEFFENRENEESHIKESQKSCLF